MSLIDTSRNAMQGVLDRIVYFNDENQYCIGEFVENKTKQRITIIGTLPGVQCGETLLINGEWTEHQAHGLQFKIQTFESKLPSTVHGIRKYLGSGLVPGIGPTYANKIVDYFKEDTLRIISEDSGRLKEIEGIGQQRAKSIKEAWDEQQAYRDVFMFLKTYGISTNRCLKLVKKYGNSAIQILKTNPYQLADEIDGIGFKTADKIALNLGLPNDGAVRIDSGVLYVLGEIVGDGHTCSPREFLHDQAVHLLEIDSSKVADRIDSLIANGHLIVLNKDNSLQLPKLEKAETIIAESIIKIQNTPSSVPGIIVEKAMEWAATRAGFEFAPEQAKAIETALTSKVSIITGGPGTGKTTILKALVDILKAKKARVVLAAPTGRAAQKMSQATNAYAQTIHRLLKYDAAIGGFAHNAETPLSIDFLVVDEASMIDTNLAKSLFRAIPGTAHVLFVGDVHQLPSVGPGSILNDMIKIGNIPTISLSRIFRQQNWSNIVTTAHAILAGQTGSIIPKNSLLELEKDYDLQFIKTQTPEECVNLIKELCSNIIPKKHNADPIMDAQVIAPMHKGGAGIENLNVELQRVLNSTSKQVQLGNNRFKLGDKVIQTRNNYDKNIFNGDLGKIISIDTEAGMLKVNFDGQIVGLERSECSDLTLAYAISIHKSQGSEFPIVIIPLLKQHFVMLKRNLIYTAITRGRKKVFIVGDPIAYAMAVKNLDSTMRNTNLLEKMKAIH